MKVIVGVLMERLIDLKNGEAGLVTVLNLPIYFA
jgi:hypothetical protein